MAPHSSTLAWKIPWTQEPGRLQSLGHKELDMTERLHFHFSLSCIGEGNGHPPQCSCLENPRDGGAWWASVYGVTQNRTSLKRLCSSSSDTTEVTQHTCMHWRRKWQPTPVFLPRESQVWRSLVGCRLWGHTESDTIDVTQHSRASTEADLDHKMTQAKIDFSYVRKTMPVSFLRGSTNLDRITHNYKMIIFIPKSSA